MSQRLQPLRILLILAGCGLFLGSCGLPPVAPDDNGNASFVRQALPKLLGRKAKGAEEIKVLADLADLLGREAVLRVLMEQPEFIDHWTNVIADDLQVQRQSTVVTSALPVCFGSPLRSGPPTGALAAFVRDQPLGSTPPGPSANMTDLIRSALVLDDLAPVYRAYLSPMAEQISDKNELVVGTKFSHVFLNRSADCVGCHHTRYSRSGPQTGWNRTHPIPLDFEIAMFGTTTTEVIIDRSFPVFRADQFPGPAAWGLEGCGGYLTDPSRLPPRTTTIAGLTGDRLGLVDLAVAFKAGNDEIVTNGVTRVPQTDLPDGLPGNQALAYMVAATVVENVWKQLMGERTTIANYFPRNPAQRDTLWSLTEGLFIPSRWSLKDLITQIMTSAYYNRAAPVAGAGTTAYVMRMIFDPWVEFDPRVPPASTDPKDSFNGQGELVHRHTPSSLLHSVSAALGWPEAERFPSGQGFPDLDLVKATGQYINENEQGRKGVDFQGLLVWESRLGLCEKPTEVAQDWIDRLMSAIPSFDAAHPGAPATVGDVAQTVKDWLLGDAELSTARASSSIPLPAERLAIANLFGVRNLNTRASTTADLHRKLRDYCGVLLRTPQFLLTGIATKGQLTLPRLRVCNSGPCTYEEICNAYAGSATRRGHLVSCNGATRSVALRPTNIARPPSPVCPQGQCGTISSHLAGFCERRSPECVLPVEPPFKLPPQLPPSPWCGPACPGPWLDFRKPTMMLHGASSGEILEAKDVQFRPAGKADYVPLTPGQLLSSGDIVRLNPGSVFRMKSNIGPVSTPEGGMPKLFDEAVLREEERALFDASRDGRAEQVGVILAKHPGIIDVFDEGGETALMKSARANAVAVMKALLEAGASISMRTPAGLTAADLTLLSNANDAVALLSSLGIRPGDAVDIKKRAETGPKRQPWLMLLAGVPERRKPEAVSSLAERFAQLKGGAWFTPQAIDPKTLPEDVQKLGHENSDLHGVAPKSFEEAKKALDEYRKSNAFKASHPHLAR